MKFREIFRFEFAYQVRRLSTWLFFAALAIIAYLFVRGNFLADALYADFFLNSPFVIAVVTVFCSLFWLLTAAAVSGEVGSRDVATGMYPLTYTSPVNKAAYLGGRFLAAFILNALIMLAVPVGIMLSVYLPGVDAQVIGPFRPVAYLTAYGFIALPNAFIGTAIQFAWTSLGRRAILSYFGGVLLLFVAYGGIISMFYFGVREEWTALLDFFAQLTILDITFGWTPMEKSTHLIEMEGTLLWSRLLWLAVALGVLAFTYFRFRFAHPTANPWWSRITRRQNTHAPMSAGSDIVMRMISIPQVRQTFGFATCIRQTLVIAWTSFRMIAKSPGGLVLLTAIAIIIVAIVPEHMHSMGTPLLPRTEYVLTFLTAPLTDPITPWVIIPLLIILYAGEVVWREREAGLGEITDAAPVPEWVLFLGKFFGLALILVAWMAMLTMAGMLIQMRLGYHTFEVGLYLHVLFGLQLPEYLLFTVLALMVQGLINQKYIGHLVALIAYVFIAFGSMLGIGHHLLLYGSAPGWIYTDMRGFGPSLGPWLWFMSYWASWALLLVVVARLLWMRGMEGSLRMRLQLARSRFTRPTAWVTVVAAALILTLGSFIFYNTNVLNNYRTGSGRMEQHAEYERRYGQYKAIPQPHLTGTNLHVEIYPERRVVDIRGTYQLVNSTGKAIDSIHVSTVPGAGTGEITFEGAAVCVLSDEDLGHRIYVLEEPLRPGDSLQLSFKLHIEPHGFRNNGLNLSVGPKSTYFRNQDWLPAIGYQPDRELIKAGDRRKHGLAPRPLIPSLVDAEANEDVTGESHEDIDPTGNGGIAFEAVVGTTLDQIAVAPGVLHRAWSEGRRRYFHYVTDAPIGNEYAFFSAGYTVQEEQWEPPSSLPACQTPVTIQIYYHPEHVANVDRMRRSVRASLNYYTREFGPYPYSYIRLIENPGSGIGMHAEASTIDFTEGFSRFNPADDSLGLDLPFAVVAHEMAHQWWGVQLPYAPVAGVGLLTESAAWYSAMGVVEETYGREQLRRLLRFFRQPYPIPPIRQSVPLLRAADPYAAYRKGPFALFCLSEYMGKERVNGAYRHLLEAHHAGTLPLATSLDLFRELKALTPDSLQTLLHDLFEANTVWELKTERPSAVKTEKGTWQVTIPVVARKVVVDSAGIETVMPMGEWIQIGVFAPGMEGEDFGETLYLQIHQIHSGKQTITVTVPGEPSDAGIDPYHLLIDLEPFNNVEKVKIRK